MRKQISKMVHQHTKLMRDRLPHILCNKLLTFSLPGNPDYLPINLSLNYSIFLRLSNL